MRPAPLLVLALFSGTIGCRPRGEEAREPVTSAAEARRIRDQDIGFYEARVAHDPYGARDRSVLGALYLQRARTTGSESDILRAESLAVTSISTRHKRNGAALSVLISSLMAQHRFVEAHRIAGDLVAQDSSDLGARATLGEVALELGRYDEARQLFSTLTLARYAPVIAPRYARWLELTGKSGEARDLLDALRDSTSSGLRAPPEQLAWLDLRIGELAAKNGRPDLARGDYNRGLALQPEDPQLLAASARLAAATGDWRAAIALGERALTARFDPMTLALLAEGYEMEGDTVQSAEYARAMEIAVSQQPAGFHRGWALFLLDHGRRVPEMLARATADYASRTDVYGADLLAWALHRAGRDREAMPHAAAALAQHTQDGVLYYHAGMIALAVGDTSTAHARLHQALEINPQFDPTAAPLARKALVALGQ